MATTISITTIPTTIIAALTAWVNLADEEFVTPPESAPTKKRLFSPHEWWIIERDEALLPERGLGATAARTEVSFQETPIPTEPVDNELQKGRNAHYKWRKGLNAANYKKQYRPRSWVPEATEAEKEADLRAMGIWEEPCENGDRPQRKRKLTEKGQAAEEDVRRSKRSRPSQ